MASIIKQAPPPSPFDEFKKLSAFEWATDAIAGSLILLVGSVVLVFQCIHYKKTMYVVLLP